MSRLLEDYLTTEERQAIDAVLSSNSMKFDHLVQLAGLDPKSDFKFSDLRALNFCGADLRGFDFTGSDLRRAAKDERTQIDESTIFTNALVEWVDERDLPIVLLMREVESAADSQGRQKALETLEKKYGKTDHVVSFVVNAACEAGSTQAFLDYVEFLPPSLSSTQVRKLITAGERVLNRKFAKSRSRTRREATTIFAANTIVDRLEKSANSFAAEWYKSLAEVVDSEQTNNALLGTAARLTKSHILMALYELAK